ncbi:MAG: serine hydrolase [Lachnospiraceae bacterium]|nr:serine hydrolase [Lachnospiraceae bacterium]
MRITSKISRLKRGIALTLFSGLLFAAGCGRAQYEMPYTVNPDVSAFRIVDIQEEGRMAEAFAVDLCVSSSDVNAGAVELSEGSGAGLFDLNQKRILYGRDIHERMYPASLTKIMTALVALKHSSADTLLTASANVTNLESGATTCGLREGDQMTLAQALHVLLINSANDAAVMIAEGIAGSIEGFSEMMNEEALQLGATNTHFVNPHGLSDEEHYTTVYDIYLIMNEAVKYDMFNEIIRMAEYTTVYNDRNGSPKELSVKSTNAYLSGTEAPAGVTVMGGKTGTTSAARNCLVLLARDTAGNPYISVILKAETRDALYLQMTELLNEINN